MIEGDGNSGGRQPDTATVVQVFQLRPTGWDDLARWCGGQQIVVNGGQAVLLPDGGGVVGLGDYAVTDDGDRFRAEPADGFRQRFAPVPDPVEPLRSDGDVRGGPGPYRYIAPTGTRD